MHTINYLRLLFMAARCSVGWQGKNNIVQDKRLKLNTF